MTCQSCGREPENGRPTHYLGCTVLSGTEGSAVPPDGGSGGGSLPLQCAKDGCTNPRAVSKGPRPAKYCDEHKTGSKK